MRRQRRKSPGGAGVFGAFTITPLGNRRKVAQFSLFAIASNKILNIGPCPIVIEDTAKSLAGKSVNGVWHVSRKEWEERERKKRAARVASKKRRA